MDRLKRYLPTREKLASSKVLSFLGPRLFHSSLWKWRRRSVALGVALGVFSAFLVPIGQIPLSAILAVLLRGNVPVAALATFITNPLTTPAILVGAWNTGSQLRQLWGGHPVILEPSVWLTSAMTSGGQLMLGLAVMAIVFGPISYVAVRVYWRVAVVRRWQTRKLNRLARRPSAASSDT